MATRYGYVWSGSGGVNPSSSVGIDTSGYTLVTETPNTNNNTSTITVACYYQTWTPYSFGNNGTGTGKITVTVNGVTKTASSSSVKYIDNQVLQEKYLGTLTFENVPHNADGSGSTSFKAVLSKFTTSGGMTMGKSLTRSATITLTKITRSSSIANDTYGQYYKNFGDYVNFTISRPSNETHTLKYWINGTEYVIGNGVETSISYAFPTNLINSFSNNAYITIPVTCYSSNGTTCSTTVYLKVPDSYVPSCSLSVSDVGDVPSSWGIWLKSKSKISGVITSSGSAGSWISSYSSYANGSSYSSSSFITDYLKNSGSQTITSTVTDSRGRQKSDSKTISAVDYWTPTLSNFSVVRCDENGVNKDDGTYGKVVCSYSIAPCNDNNTKSLIVKYGDATKTFTLNSYSGSVEATASELFSGLSTASNHAFEFYLTDYFNPNGIKYSFTMTPAFTTISYLNGGKGVSIGQVATEEGFHCYMDAEFHGNVKGDKWISWVRYQNSISIPSGGFDNRIRVPFNLIKKIPNNHSKLSLSNSNVLIGKGVKTIKISYDARIDWDAQNDVVYHFMITTSGGDQWETHSTVYKTNSIQYHTGFCSFILDVAEGTAIALLMWSANTENTVNANFMINMCVEVIDFD